MSNYINSAITGVSTFLDGFFPSEVPSTSTNSNAPHPTSCQLCGGDNNPEIILICDGCEAHMHTTCLNLPGVPPGDWFCPKCVRLGKQVKEHIPVSTDVVVIYERVSSAGQNEPQFGRVGLETQNAAVLTFCLQRGIIVKHTFTDVGSARNLMKTKELKRGESPYKLEEYGEMMEYARRSRRPIVILVYSVSRFGRNLNQVVEVLADLHEMDCYVYSVSEKLSSHDPRFLELAKFSQEHSDALSTLIKASVERRRTEGHFIGIAPYGYECYRDGHGKRCLRQLASEAVGLGIIRGNTAWEAVKQLRQRNIPARSGIWTSSKVLNIKKRIAGL